jgi:hypothetical protein
MPILAHYDVRHAIQAWMKKTDKRPRETTQKATDQEWYNGVFHNK